MALLSFLLNLPYTLCGILLALISGPRKIYLSQCAMVFEIKRFWWQFGYMKDVRAANIGHVVLLGPKLAPKDLEHELIHVEQYMRYPFIYPFLYYFELFKKGYRNNRFEDEAYRKAGNFYGKLD